MKLSWRAGPRVSFVGPVIFMGLVASFSYALLRHHGLIPAMQCPWRAIVKIPCPFCGTTTTLRHLSHLRPLDALVTNPVILLMTLAAILVASNELFALVFRRRVTLSLSRKEGWAAAGIFLASVAANWIYVLFLRGAPPVP